MTGSAVLLYLAYFATLLVLVRPLGAHIANVYEGRPTFLDRIVGPVERLTYRVAGVDAAHPHDWREYALALLGFNAAGVVVVYLLQRCQAWLPLNPQGFAAVSPDSAFDTAVSFVTNTNWQGYAGESTMSYLTQMAGLGVQNFLSAATGMAVFAAVARGFARRGASDLGNFWVDLVRSTLHVLLPLSTLLALALASLGVVQSFSPYAAATLLEPLSADVPVLDRTGQPVAGADGRPSVQA